MATKTRRRGAWWIRWRERKLEGGWTNRSLTMEGSERDAELVRLDIEQQLAERGWVDRATLRSEPPASILEGLLALIDARVAAGRWTGNTPNTYRSYVTRIGATLHRLTGLPTSEPLPVTLLQRDLFDRCVAAWQLEEVSQQTQYGAARLLLEAWRWMADDPRRWPHTPRPPHSSRDYLPAPPAYVRTDAPSLAHVDAMIRALDRRGQHPETLLFAVVMRYLGWRGGQIAALRHEDLDLGRMTVTLPTGKSRAERAERRVVPLPRRLLEEPGVRAAFTRASSGPVFRGRTGAGRTWIPSRAFAVAWAHATDAEDVPENVWNPPQRRHARPTHALRAAIKNHWLDAGAPREVVDYLVGHRPRTVGDRHYGRRLVEAARPWVDQVPAVAWTTKVLHRPRHRTAGRSREAGW